MTAIDALLWPESELHQGLAKLGVFLGSSTSNIEQDSRWVLDTHPNQWLTEKCDKLTLGAQRVAFSLGELEQKAQKLGPCIIKLSDSKQQPGYLVIVKTSKKSIQVITPNASKQQLTPVQLLDSVITWLRDNNNAGTDKLLQRFEASTDGLTDELYRKLFVSLMAGFELNQIWTVASKDKEQILPQLLEQGLLRYLATFVFGLIATQLFFMSSWFVLGSNILAGRTGSGWLPIWLMLLLGFIVSRLYTRKKQQEMSLMISIQIKRRMLVGMTKMPLEAARSDGPCNLLTRCYESGQFESASVSLVLGALSTMVSLFIAFAALIGLQMWGMFTASIVVGLLMLIVMWRLYYIEQSWTDGRLRLTHSLAELMIGQRTRRVQEAIKHRHKEEDQKLNSYIKLQQQRDKLQVIYGLIPSTWNVLGIGVLLFGFATGSNSINLPAAAGIWLLISAAINQLSTIYLQVIRLLVAWTTISPLLAHQPNDKQKGELTLPVLENSTRMLEVRDLAYRYPDRNVNVLDGGSLHLASHDKVILEGRSGSGKSTLISLLTGIRQATRGSILLAGVEQNMVSKSQWRQKVVMVPQYHENFLFTETLAFNLLLGTQWPAEPEQLDKARQICVDLGLSELLNKMPAELMQVVGEMGWNLSHGEKSRVYVARAILQQPDLLILDESLASLDPVNSNRVLDCVEKYCKAVIIVAHP